MKKLALVAALALALTGCSVGGSDAPEAVESAPVAAQQVSYDEWAQTADPEQVWAYSVFSEWMTDEGLKGVEDALWPFNLVTGYESTADGVITLYVNNSIENSPEPLEGGYFPKEHLGTIAGVMMEKTGGDRPELKKIIAVTENGEYRAESNNYSFK